VQLSSSNEGHLSGLNLVTLPVSARDPTPALQWGEELAKAGAVRSSQAAALELQQKCMRFARTSSQLLGVRGPAIEFADRRARFRMDAENLQLHAPV